MGKIRKSDTLRGVFIRYVLLLLFALCAFGGCIIVLFNLLVNTGLVYPANYAERKINEAYDLLQTADTVTADMIPPLCRYAVFLWTVKGAARSCRNIPWKSPVKS